MHHLPTISRAIRVATLLALACLVPGCAPDTPAPRTVSPTSTGEPTRPADDATTGPPRRIATH